ncbi:hypothetical protein CHARACLAT_019796 [Characodon lateralis]|uniref:Uncharacterized protein n=1 Tax=Characodon lateralis TaxID=208331 RepID=A0ABU7D1D7_9TELE|nr:hypothetical protein [Characodon lateralis]
MISAYRFLRCNGENEKLLCKISAHDDCCCIMPFTFIFTSLSLTPDFDPALDTKEQRSHGSFTQIHLGVGDTGDGFCVSGDQPDLHHHQQVYFQKRRLRSIRTKTSGHKNSFFPSATSLVNKARKPP